VVRARAYHGNSRVQEGAGQGDRPARSSGGIVSQLTDQRLIDEYRLPLNPVIHAEGRTRFAHVSGRLGDFAEMLASDEERLFAWTLGSCLRLLEAGVVCGQSHTTSTRSGRFAPLLPEPR
jgi:hypothetical protein